MPTPLETVRAYYARIDAVDLDAAFDLFDENAAVRFGEHEPIVGREAVAAHVKKMVVPVAKELEHRVVSSYEVRTGDTTTVICEAVVTYTMLHSGNVHSHNAVTISEVNGDGRIVRQRNVGNLGPVIADHKTHAPS
ncbi:MAG TPA: nuclear transport factor 2 family protein [Streptomyces sp.]|uniref:nuclear transport factor 2 family protein n=1 Tax=Streptomyces sp. TaxID=1931 RepID=UPI002BF409C4|nr:nuclear transport factor 2 family protein [Streptomyces sp.]HWU11835.1 nuclear transport factor 2 family protein [Streptomyces sp.]